MLGLSLLIAVIAAAQLIAWQRLRPAYTARHAADEFDEVRRG